MISKPITISFIALLLINMSQAHGRLVDPVARSSAWRKDHTKFPSYYDDNSMNCGGIGMQIMNGGKCGICGENFASKKKFEKGGILYRGHIVKNYSESQLIDVVVEITANHWGFFEFSVCNVDNNRIDQDATQECLDKTKLFSLNNETQINIQKAFNGKIKLTLQLPSKLTCKHCVFQWKYTARNSWNTDPITGKKCVGCGPQEQFYGCSDISISANNSQSINSTVYSTSTTKFTTLEASLSEATRSTFKPTATTNPIFIPTTFYKLCFRGDGFYTWSDCKSFYRCVDDQIFYFDCPVGTLFNLEFNVCDWPYNVKCKDDVK